MPLLRKKDKGGGMMERLTEKRDGQNVIPLRQDGKNMWALTLAGMGDAPTHFLYGDYADKLAEYEDLEEQGLLLRLPCKIGTSVYMVAQDCGGDTLDCMRGDCEGCPYLYSFVEENKFEAYMCDDIGKTVFITQAEAEQKLKEMESD